ncbi:PREDICTED: uncharacterized protein LOC109220017 [Nicotiana attenuata]|uniref:uncharacterized protein LOC109220017 n=1 Tax=Nicotiana attenuata TaxID=49451 RepID=UPI000904ADD0|nr:PREDICTED: uncharacterized protein LOC109220017 [Nicotiana attenuata]
MGLDPMNQSIAKNAADGSFMDNTFTRVTQILDQMAEYNQAWHSKDTTGGIPYGTPSLTNMLKENQERDQVIAGLATNVNVLTKMFTESKRKKVNVVEDVQPMSNEDYEEANYVNNSQGGYQRQPYQGSRQQNQWRPTRKGKATNRSKMTKESSSSESKLENMLERILQNQERSDTSMKNMTELAVEAQVEVPIVVGAERLPNEVKIQEVNHEEVKGKVKETPKTLAPIPRPPSLFPQGLVRKVDDSELEKFYDILNQLSVNIPFVEAFQEMSGFAKHLKDLITKKKTTRNDVVNVTHRVSSIIATTTVQKKEDPGAFTIPCTIGLCDFARALCDNGARINLVPLAIYKKKGLGMPRLTSMRLQMADRSIKRPLGIVDNALVKVGKFLLPADFVILDYAVDKKIPIILGGPFLATGRALMNLERNEIKF